MSTYRSIRTFYIDNNNNLFDVKMNPLDICSDKVDIVDVDDTPVDGATTHPISSNWAYDYLKKMEDEQTLRDLEEAYETSMENERHTSNRRGYEVR